MTPMFRYATSLLALLVCAGAQAETWQLLSPRPTPETIRSCVYSASASAYVAVGTHGRYLISSNGSDWQAGIVTTENDNLLGLAASDSLIVATSFGKAFTSTDGRNWTTHTVAGDATTFSDVIWTGSQFAATGIHSQSVRSSLNGSDWTDHPTGAGKAIEGIAWNGALYVIVARDGVIMTSSHLDSWTPATSGVTVSLNSVVWADGAFVAVGGDGTILRSSNGADWTSQGPGGGYAFTKVRHDGSRFVAVGDNGMLYTSSDGLNWTHQLNQPSEETGKSLHAICNQAGKTIVAGDGGLILSSSNGSDWSKHSPDLGILNSIAWNGSRYVAVGLDGTVLTSSNGASWTKGYVGHGTMLYSVIWAEELGLFVTTGYLGYISTSPDGLNWTMRSSGTMQSLMGVAWNGTVLVATGDNGTVLRSSNGTDWDDHSVTFSHTSATLRVRHLGGRFIATAFSGPTLTSSDGIGWTASNLGTMGFVFDVAWNGSVYANGRFISSDGVNWTAASTQISNLYGITHDGEKFIAVGASGMLRHSSDGSTWVERPSLTSQTMKGIITTERTSIIVGDKGIVYFRSGIELAETDGGSSVTEGGASDSYSLVLSAPPVHDVVITISADAGLEVNPTELTFTSANWGTPQIVTLSAIDNDSAEGGRTLYISHVVSSADTAFDGMAIADLAVTVIDNDNDNDNDSSSGAVGTGSSGGGGGMGLPFLLLAAATLLRRRMSSHNHQDKED